MPCADRGEALVEIILTSLFYSQCLKIAKKVDCLVVARWVAAFDLLLDLAPDAGAALLENLELGAACFLGLRRLAAPFRLTTLCVGALTGLSDLLRPHLQCTCCTEWRRCRVLLAKSAPERGAHIGIAVNGAQQQFNLLTFRNHRQRSTQIVLAHYGIVRAQFGSGLDEIGIDAEKLSKTFECASQRTYA